VRRQYRLSVPVIYFPKGTGFHSELAWSFRLWSVFGVVGTIDLWELYSSHGLSISEGFKLDIYIIIIDLWELTGTGVNLSGLYPCCYTFVWVASPACNGMWLLAWLFPFSDMLFGIGCVRVVSFWVLFELVVGGSSIMSSSISLKKPLIVLCGGGSGVRTRCDA
jgi:hypothetical protein